MNKIRLIILLAVIVALTPFAAQVVATQTGPAAPPLARLLRDDGTLDLATGFQASLDPRGWRMLSEPGQPPRFAKARATDALAVVDPGASSATAPGDEFWDDRFDVLGVSGYVRAISVSGPYVYVGGNFSAVGGVGASSVARWDSTSGTWSALGSGIPGYVYAIAATGRYVYFGGLFSGAGGQAAQNIARWDSVDKVWSGLGGGVSGPVYALEADVLGNVYVGGLFTAAGNVPNTRNVAFWNRGTSSWSALGSGASATVYAIAEDGRYVYVGGLFNSVSDGAFSVPGTQGVARWDTQSDAWSALGSGIPGYVYAISVSGGDVYAGGLFNAVGGFPSPPGTLNIAGWNSTSGAWFALDEGILGYVNAIAVRGDEVFAGGRFDAVGGVPSVPNTRNIARWDTTTSSWAALGSGVSAYVYALGLGDGLYVGGLFNTAGDKPSRNFARWYGFSPPLPPPPPPPPPEQGSVSGRVISPSTEFGVFGAYVQLCPRGGGPCVWSGVTDEDGGYAAAGLADGDYVVTAYPPPESCEQPATIGPLTIAGGSSLTEQDIWLGSCPIEPPPGTRISPSRSGGSGVPVVHWRDTLELTTQGCAGGSASYELWQGATLLRSGPMAESPPGTYQATITPLHPNHGRAEIRITIACPGGGTETSEFAIYIDPSGTVRTLGGTPVVSATVTLYFFDDASQEFVQVPDGDAIMSPENRTNPDRTDANGHFGWDVVAGFYTVRAEKEGCVAPFNPEQSYVETDVLVIPPPVTDLDLRLDCGTNKVYLPLLLR
jgi:hypothetical protein